MATKEPDIKEDIKVIEGRGESVNRMEPMAIEQGSKYRVALTVLALELAQRSAGFRRSLPESLLTSLAGLVRAIQSSDPDHFGWDSNRSWVKNSGVGHTDQASPTSTVLR